MFNSRGNVAIYIKTNATTGLFTDSHKLPGLMDLSIQLTNSEQRIKTLDSIFDQGIPQGTSIGISFMSLLSTNNNVWKLFADEGDFSAASSNPTLLERFKIELLLGKFGSENIVFVFGFASIGNVSITAILPGVVQISGVINSDSQVFVYRNISGHVNY